MGESDTYWWPLLAYSACDAGSQEASSTVLFILISISSLIISSERFIFVGSLLLVELLYQMATLLLAKQPTSSTETVNYLYDGSGTRVATQSTVDGTTTLTSYIGSVEEVQTSGSSTQTTTSYAVGGKRVATDVNGTFYYFGYDALGSQVAVLNSTGSLVWGTVVWTLWVEPVQHGDTTDEYWVHGAACR